VFKKEKKAQFYTVQRRQQKTCTLSLKLKHVRVLQQGKAKSLLKHVVIDATRLLIWLINAATKHRYAMPAENKVTLPSLA
jgi:hypothetical protein